MILSEDSASFWSHAEELRQTLIKSFFIMGSGILLALYFYYEIFQILTGPVAFAQEQQGALQKQEIRYERIVNTSDKEIIYQTKKAEYTLPPRESIVVEKDAPSLIVLGPIEGMLIMLKVCCWTGAIGTSPLWLYFLLRFISPALEAKHRHFLFPFLGFSLLFLAFGVLFGFFVTIPIANQYLSLFNQNIGTNLWSLSHYLDYSILLLLANGFAFEVAVILFFLVHYEVISVESLIDKRRHMIVGAFILGALLTPPDVLTQCLLAIPLVALYELTILYGRMKRGSISLSFFEQQL